MECSVGVRVGGWVGSQQARRKAGGAAPAGRLVWHSIVCVYFEASEI